MLKIKKRQSRPERWLSIVLIALSVLSANGHASNVVDRIIAVVNEDIITETDVDEMLAPLYIQLSTVYGGEQLAKKLEEARIKVLNQLIDQKILLSEARKLNIKVTGRELGSEVEKIKKKFKSEKEFKLTLASQNITLKQLKKRYEEKIMINKMVSKKIAPKISVSPTEITEYFLLNKEEFTQPERAGLKNILIKVTEDRPPGEAYSLTLEIHERLKEGGSFEALAKEYSDGPGKDEGGDMGFVSRGDLRKELDEVAFGLLPGEISDIVLTPIGYHIFMLTEKRDAVEKTIDESREEIEAKIFSEKLTKEIKGWVEELKKNAYVSIR
ncbi:peptidylprolyl isomerase [Candidatus Omnitrophota bacterium]